MSGLSRHTAVNAQVMLNPWAHCAVLGSLGQGPNGRVRRVGAAAPLNRPKMLFPRGFWRAAMVYQVLGHRILPQVSKRLR